MRFFIIALLSFQYLLAQNIISGPVVGAVTSTSATVVLQTSQPDSLIVIVSNDLHSGTDSFMLTTHAENYGFVKLHLHQLFPYTNYFLEVSSVLNPAEKINASFRTFPREGERGIYSFVTGSCQETENMKVFDVIPLHRPLFFMHTGDYTYPDYQIAPDYSSRYNDVALSYTKRYNEKQMKEMLLSVPIDYVFDDNDHVGSSSGRYAKNSAYHTQRGLLRVDNFLNTDTFPEYWLKNVIRGYVDFFPHYPLPDTAEAIHHSFKMGNAEFFVIDRNSSRIYPNEVAFEKNRRGKYRFNPPKEHCMFCEKQMQWLKEGLKNSDADWKFIVSGVPLNRSIEKLIRTGIKLQNYGAKGYSGFHMATGFGNYWAGFPHEMNDFYAFIEREKIKNVIVISGDTHHNVMDDGKNAGLPEMNASGLSVTETYLAYYVNIIGMASGSFNIREIWNQGGNGIGNKNFKNAFGKITIYGNEFVELSLIDEDNEVISSFRVPFKK
jgi:phosphodiesterase/alkaline phosphatase D-like protein